MIPHIQSQIPASPGAFVPTEPGSPDYMMGGVTLEQEGIISAEECEDVGDMIWGIPVMLGGEYLEPPERMRRAWEKALCRYCNKKGIDPEDYMFDELPLLVATAQIGLFMKKAHKTHKAEKKEYVPKEHEKTGFDTGKGVTDVVHEIEPQETEKFTGTASSGGGGDNLPEEETELTEEFEDESTTEHPDSTGADDAGQGTDSESSE